MHKLFARQLAKAKTPEGTTDVAKLEELVVAAYTQADADRRRTDRSISLMIEELDALNRQLEQLVDERTRQLRARENDLQAQNLRFDAALNNMSQGLMMFDSSSRLVIWNQRLLDMYRLPAESVRVGMTPQELLEARERVGTFEGDIDEVVRTVRTSVLSGKSLQRISDLPDGRTVAISTDPMAGGGWVTTHQDITERRRIEKQIAHMAHHDALTDLPNRALFRERLGEALVRARRGHRFAVLCLDLDHFKSVNDTLGHPIGDELLIMVAAALRKSARENDTVARFGGDEFAIILSDTASPTDAANFAQRVCETLSEPFDFGGQAAVVGVSIGIAMAPDDGIVPDELLKNADLALYRAKADGRGTYRFFEAAMDARMKARRQIEMDLRHALTAGEFELFYQPIVNLSDSAITCCEALIRWRHPVRGMISPADFIPIAEEMGLIVPLGEWVLRKACSDAARWPKDVNVAVNLSAIQVMNRSLVSIVMNTLATTGLSPHRLELEITESVLMQNTDVTLSALHHLRKLGVRISLDDFGTGYSSLKYLRSFPFDKIKIDRCFISDFVENDDSYAIVRAIAGLANGLGIETTAEGVETEEQFEKLRALGCTEMQGFFFSPPRRVNEIARMLIPRPEARALIA